jgi:UDP:flavonoid glycosyltransferase YjiC (YdhE family)
MTKYLFTTLPTNDLGLITRSLPIARELSRLGHGVVFCSPAKAPRRLIADAGFENLMPRHPLYELIDVDKTLSGMIGFVISRRPNAQNGTLLQFLKKAVPALPVRYPPRTDEVWDMDHAGAMMGMLNEGFVRANCEAFRDVIESCGADVVVDYWNPFAVIAARAAGKPVVTVIQADAHPDSEGFIWWRRPPPQRPTPVPVMNRVLADHGLPPIATLAELSVGDLTLVVGMPETDPLPESARVQYIGAVLWQAENARLPEWISTLSGDRPVVWVYSGNPQYSSSDDTLNSIVVLHACKEALAGEDLQVVLSTGHHPLPASLLPLPANFRHEPYVPGLQMAERADLLIHHGGYGSCQTGLYAGKPAVILPTYSERLSNARRMEAAGAAQIVAVTHADGKKQVRSEELRAGVRRVIADPSFSANARKLGEKLRSYGGATRAARLIEEFSRDAFSARNSSRSSLT